MKRLKPLNDVVFKKIFGEKVDKELLISFLNAILNSEVTDIEIQEEKLSLDSVDDKLGILDLKATLQSGEKVNIEVQQLNQYNMIKRTLFYWSKLYNENFKAKADYNQLTKTITINILGFSLFHRESFYSSYHVYEDRTLERLNDDLEIHFIELPKFKQMEKNLHNPLHRWLLFLVEDGNSNVLEEIIMMDNVIKQADEKLIRLSSDPETRRLYELREKQIRDELSNHEGAKQEGMEIKTREFVETLLSDGIPLEKVAEYAKIPIEKVKEIQNSLNKG